MAERKQGKKVKKKNPNLRLIKNGDEIPKKEKRKADRQEKLRFGKGKRMLIIGSFLVAVMVIVLGGYYYIMTHYKVTTVYVEGNIHYTNEEIIDMVMGGKYGDNSLILSMKYRDQEIDNIPFVETMDVTVESNDTIRITVYEKALAGYVSYLGRYVYFDKDGIVVETSEEKTSGIPQVTGLTFDYVILYEPLPVEKPEIFDEVLNITQQLSKYSLVVDKIYFDKDYQVTLLFGDVKIALGSNTDIDEKIMKLQSILPNLEGKRGTLDMRELREDMKNYSFESE